MDVLYFVNVRPNGSDSLTLPNLSKVSEVGEKMTDLGQLKSGLRVEVLSPYYCLTLHFKTTIRL